MPSDTKSVTAQTQPAATTPQPDAPQIDWHQQPDMERLAEARRRIAVCRETRAAKLDLEDLLAAPLMPEIAALTWLTSLDLEHCAIGDDGAKHLASLTSLTKLDLEDNRIGPSGAKHLAGLTSLTELDLEDNAIGADGASVLSGLTNLTDLDLEGNDLGPDGAEPLRGLTQLTTLGLASTGVRNLSPLIHLSRLETLNVSGCAIDHPIEALWRMPSLRNAVTFKSTIAPAETGEVVPDQALSQTPDENCLPRLLAHFDALHRHPS